MFFPCPLIYPSLILVAPQIVFLTSNMITSLSHALHVLASLSDAFMNVICLAVSSKLALCDEHLASNDGSAKESKTCLTPTLGN